MILFDYFMIHFLSVYLRLHFAFRDKIGSIVQYINEYREYDL